MSEQELTREDLLALLAELRRENLLLSQNAQRNAELLRSTTSLSTKTTQELRKSKRKALRWYRRALAAGEAAAAHNIATVYRDRGNLLRATRWFRYSVALGNHGSNLELGRLLLGWLGRPREALSCFRAVGADETQAVVEAARAWAALAEEVLARGAAAEQDVAAVEARS